MKASEAQEHACMAVVWAVPASWTFAEFVLGPEAGHSDWVTLAAIPLFLVFAALSLGQLLKISDKRTEDDPNWHRGIVVKDVKVKHWEAISERIRLITCAAWVMELSVDKVENGSGHHRSLSESLLGEINLMIKVRWDDDDLVAEVAKDRAEHLNLTMTMEERDEEIRELEAEYQSGQQALPELGLLKDDEDDEYPR